MSKQSDAEGELTSDPNDKHPHRRKVQRAISKKTFRKNDEPLKLGAVYAKKHLTLFPIRKRKKGRGIRSQVTVGDYVYKRSKARPGSPLYGKWYKIRKGESLREATIVDFPPIEKDEE